MKKLYSDDELISSAEEVGQISDGYHTFDELYEHRCTLFAALMQQLSHLSWFSFKHHDGEEWEGWFICGISLPTGDVSYHLPSEMLEVVACTGAEQLEFGKEWDGHTSDDVIKRIQEYIVTPGS
jgi:hypothetical protein